MPIDLNLCKINFSQKNNDFCVFPGNKIENKFYTKLEKEFYKFLKKRERTEFHDILNLNLVYIIRECTSIFNNLLIIKGNKNLTCSSSDLEIYNFLKKKRIQIKSEYVFKRLRFKKTPIKNSLRVVRSFFNKENYTCFPPKLLPKDKFIFTFHIQEQMFDIAKSIGKTINLCKYNQFIDPLRKSIPNNTRVSLKNISNECIEFIKKIFNEYSICLEDFVIKPLRKFIYNLLNVTFQINCSLINKKHFFSKEVFLGSMGILPNKIISSLKGLDCYTFDHGVGTSWINVPVRTLDEFRYSKKFIMYGKKIPSFLKNRNNIITVCSKKKRLISKNKIGGRKVLYITSHEKSNFAFSPLLIDDFKILNFRYKIIKELKNYFSIYFKPHPSSNIKIIENFVRQTDVNVEFETFENIFLEYDYLIFENFGSSTFASALSSNKPIIILNFFDSYLEKQIKKDLMKRVSVVQIKDKKNKFFFDSKSLGVLLKESVIKKNNTDFFYKYF